MDTMTQLQEVFHSVFDDDTIVLTRETTAQDIEAWDSVQNVELMLQVEEAFKVRLSTGEIAYLKCVGDLVDVIDSKKTK